MRLMIKSVAVIFDFDDTLVPDSTTRLIEEHGLDARTFWNRDTKRLIAQGYDPALAYLKLLLDNIGDGKPLGALTANRLRRFGASLTLHPGVAGLFADLRRIARNAGARLEAHVISGGLYEVVEGSPVLRKNLNGIYASRLGADVEGGVLRYVKRCVTFTEKTRYLFEINKGLKPEEALRNPYLVNRHVPPEARPVPFENMIFVGDGLTDVPCFSFLKSQGGTSFGVFNPAEKKSAKRALLEFLGPRRVLSIHAPRYGPKDELGALLRSAVGEVCER